MVQHGRKVHYHCMGDQHCLPHAPCAVDAVKWSEDNLIAVSAGHTVVIASPADITGPRAYAALDSNNSSVFLGCKPDKHEDSVPIGLACMMDTGPVGHTQTSVRALSWSPAGCTQSAACLLALVSNDGKVQLFQPPSAPLQSRWELMSDLTEQLQQHMEETAWQDAELPAAIDDTAVLRLRGGGPLGKPRGQTKKQQQEGQQQQHAEHTKVNAAAEVTVGSTAAATNAVAGDAGPPAKRQKRTNPGPLECEQQGEQQQQDKAQVTAAAKPRGRAAAGSAKRGAKAAAAAVARDAVAEQGAGAAASPAPVTATPRKRGRAAKAAAGNTEDDGVSAVPAGEGAAAAKPAGKRRASSAKGRKAAAEVDQAEEAAAAAPENNQLEDDEKDVMLAATAAAAPAEKAGAAGKAAAASGSSKAKSSRQTSISKKTATAVAAGASKEPRKKKQSTAAEGKKAAAAAPPAAEADPHAHLPRTAAGAAAFAVGGACEVMNDEEGLRGAWWCGKIVQMQYGYALFEYEALFEDTEGTTKLKEWFPIPGPGPAADPAAAEANAGGCYFHTSTANMIRPKPPQELLALSGKPAPGDAVEVFVDDGWWRTRILSVTAVSVSVPIAHPLNIVSVPLQPSHVRHVTVWECDTGIWDHGVLLEPGAPPPATGAEPAAAAAAAQQQPKARKESVSNKKNKAAAGASPEQDTGAESAQDVPAAAAAQGPSDKAGTPAGRPGRRRSSAAAKASNRIDDVVSDVPGFSSSDDEDAPALRAASTANKGGKRTSGKEKGGKKRRGGSGSESDGSDWALSDEEDSEDHEITDDVEEEKTEEGTPEEPTVSEDDDELPRGRQQTTSKHIAEVRSVPMQAGSLHPLHRGDGFRKNVGQLPHFSAAAAERLQQQQQGRQGLVAAAKAKAAVSATVAAAVTTPPAAPEEEEEQEAGDDGPLAAAGKRSAAKAKKHKKSKEAGSESDDAAESDVPHSETEDEAGDPEAAYKVPDDLDPQTFTSMLPVRIGLADAQVWIRPGLMPRAIAARFSQLRADVPKKKLPHYKKGQHLRKNDLRLWTRVWAEFTRLHEADMAKHTTAKKLITLAKANIRKAVLQTFEAKVRNTSTPYVSKGYVPLDGSNTVIDAGPSPSKKSSQSLSKAMVAAAKEAVPSPAPRVARPLSALRTGGKRKRDFSVGDGLGLIAAAAAAAAAGVEGGVIGPLASVLESQDAAVGCKSLTKLLSRQALGLEVQLAANPLRGPSLRVKAMTAVSARLRGYAPAFAYDNCGLTALEGPKIDAAAWEARRTFMAATSVAWSPACILGSSIEEGGVQQPQQEGLAERVALLAIGTKAGCVQLWRYNMPQQYKGASSSRPGLAAAEAEEAAAAAAAGLAAGEQPAGMQYLGAVQVTSGAYVTSLTWAVLPAARAAAGAANVGAGTGSSSCAVLPGSAVRRGDGDVLLLAVGTSVGDVTLWSADPTVQVSSGTPCEALTALGTAILPDRRAAMVLDMAVVAAAAANGAAGSSSGSGGWQLLLAAGKTLGCISAWRSGVLCSNIHSSSSSLADRHTAAAPAAGYSTEQLSVAVTSGTCTGKRCHGVAFVTGVLWSPLDQQLASSGADGQLLLWAWGEGGLQPGRTCSRFNRQWLRPSVACALTPAARKAAPMAGLAGSGSRMILAVARDWKVTEAAGELDSTAGAAGVRINASAWEKLMHGALQLFSSYGPADDLAALQHLLTQRLLPALMWQGAEQSVLPAAALWDMAVVVARCGWQSLSPKQVTAAAGDGNVSRGSSPAAADAGSAAASEQQQQGSRQKQHTGTEQGAADTNMADLIPVRDARTEVVQRMAKKQLKEVQLQLELLSQLLHGLTEPFNAAVAAGSTAGTAAGSTAGTAAGSTAGDAKLSYRKRVPLSAWRGLQLACYLSRCLLRLWKGPQHEAVQQLPPAVQRLSQLEQLLHRWELELLQRHMYCSLSAGLDYCLDLRTAAALATKQRALVAGQQQQQMLSLPQQLPAAAAAAAHAGSSLGFEAFKFPLSEVLMADWVSLNIQSPDLNVDELLRPAAVVYASYGLTAPLAVEGEGSMPARELNPLGPEDLPPVSVCGQGLEAIAQASVVAEPGAAEAEATGDAEGDIQMDEADPAQAEKLAAAAVRVSWPRCSTTLMLCPASSSISSSWGCSSCGRRYTVPPSRGLVTTAAAAGAEEHEAAMQPCMPRCLVCGCRLSPGGAAAVGLPGAVAGVKHVLDGSPVLGVGMSLTDMLLPV